MDFEGTRDFGGDNDEEYEVINLEDDTEEGQAFYLEDGEENTDAQRARTDKTIEVIEICDSPEGDEADGISLQEAEDDIDHLKCAICLLSYKASRAMLDRCFHSFCKTCIIEWSHRSLTCPLCKTPFQSILYDIHSPTLFKQLVFAAKQTMTSTSTSHQARSNMPHQTSLLHSSGLVHAVHPEGTRWGQHTRTARERVQLAIERRKYVNQVFTFCSGYHCTLIPCLLSSSHDLLDCIRHAFIDKSTTKAYGCDPRPMQPWLPRSET